MACRPSPNTETEPELKTETEQVRATHRTEGWCTEHDLHQCTYGLRLDIKRHSNWHSKCHTKRQTQLRNVFVPTI